jgi:hypothetical protein
MGATTIPATAIPPASGTGSLLGRSIIDMEALSSIYTAPRPFPLQMVYSAAPL